MVIRHDVVRLRIHRERNQDTQRGGGGEWRRITERERDTKTERHRQRVCVCVWGGEQKKTRMGQDEY